MKCYIGCSQSSLCHQRLNTQQKQGTMRFNHHANTSLSGLREECRHGHLSPGMEVDLRLLDEYHLPRTGGQERLHYGERLRDPETDIGDADQILGSSLALVVC